MITREQMRECGMSDDIVERWAAAGLLHRLHRGVYAFGNPRIVAYGRLLAGLLTVGGDSFLSHRTTAAVRGLRNLNLREIELTVVAASTRRRPGLKLHRTATAPAADEVTVFNGLRLSSVPRMLVELAPRETPAELSRLITEAARKQLLDLDAVERTLARHAGRPGIRKLRRALAAYRPQPDRKSGLERAFDELLARHPELPEPLRNVHLHGWELDCYWPQQRVALELDGRPYHVAVKDLERDRLKDAKLLAKGIRPIRITDSRFGNEPLDALSDVLAVLGVETEPARGSPTPADQGSG